MFGAKQANPYDEIVTKTTDENLTSENWELILNLCDKVNDEGEQGARNVIAAVLKRLAHRNPNVQLYTLALAEALSKNCGGELHQEMASRSFTQGLEKLVTDRMTHEKVKRRGLYLISLWTGEFENNSQLGLMEELYNNLKAKNFKFEQVAEPPPPDVDDEVRRKEEEELQRVIEMSMRDKGGRNSSAWNDNLSSGAGGSGVAAASSSIPPGPSSSGGYTPTEPPKSAYPASETHHHLSASSHPLPSSAPTVPDTTSSQSTVPPESSSSTQSTATNVVTRVRALHTFEPTVAGELAFEKGDIIKVTDRAYDNWWRGQLRGRTGIFPVNYVEPLPDLTPGELAREAEQEAAVFAQAANIDKLINMLRDLDPAKDNLADNEEIQELYRSSMSLRPKIVKLIDKYSQKRAELVAMNENFVKARGVFEQMMEDSLARHTAVYETTQPTFRKVRPESRSNATDYHPSTYGWNTSVYEQPGYSGYPATPSSYGPDRQYTYQSQPYGDSGGYGGHYGGQLQPPGSQPYSAGDPSPASGPTRPHGQVPQAFGHGPAPIDQSSYTQQNPQVQSQAASQPQPQGPQPYSAMDPSPASGPTQPLGQMPQAFGHGPASIDQSGYTQQNLQAQSQTSPQPQAQPQTQPQPRSQQQTQPQPQPQPQPQAQAQDQQHPQHSQQPFQQHQGPPYVYDPNAQYADPNVQAWAQYYAQGGTDPAGAVYFVSIPGVTDPPVGGSSGPQSTSPASVSQAQSPHHQSSPPATAQPQTQPGLSHGPSSVAYHTYNAASTSPERHPHPQLHIQPDYPGSQPPNGPVSEVDPQGPGSAVFYGAAGASQPYGIGAYPGGFPAQQDPRTSTSPVHDGQAPGQVPPIASGLES